MSTTYYIGADVHSKMTELAVQKRSEIVVRYSVPTTIPAYKEPRKSQLHHSKFFALPRGMAKPDIQYSSLSF